MTIIRKVGITETSQNVWRVTFDGRVQGDSRGFSRAQAVAEAERVIRCGEDDGDWQGSVWVSITNVLDI